MNKRLTAFTVATFALLYAALADSEQIARTLMQIYPGSPPASVTHIQMECMDREEFLRWNKTQWRVEQVGGGLGWIAPDAGVFSEGMMVLWLNDRGAFLVTYEHEDLSCVMGYGDDWMGYQQIGGMS